MFKATNLKGLRNSAPLLIAVALLVWFICSQSKSSMFTPEAAGAPLEASGESINVKTAGCALGSGVGLASSLLPREVATEEDFGQFAPDDILKGQNFLDPRQQMGYPETIGGTLRNANQQIRTEPPNPKSAFVWSNSTIVPDLMRRPLN
jgi:hypothetical protein